MKASPWILAVAPGAAFLVCGALFWFSTRPKLAQGEALKLEIQKVRREADERRSAVKDAEYFVRCEAKPVEAALTALQRIIGPENRLNHFFPLLSDLARRAGVRLTTCGKGRQEVATVSGADPTHPMPGGDRGAGPGSGLSFSSLMIEIGAQGPPEKLLHFIDLLEREFRPITVTEATIQRHEGRLLEASVLIQAKFVIRGAS